MFYRVKKILNNNVAIACDESNEEVLITGRGLGFSSKVGDYLPDRMIHRVYVEKDRSAKRRLAALFNEIPYESVVISEKIVDYASAALGREFGQNLVVSLADHISFAVKRAQEGTYQPNLLNEEMENFYPSEYTVARQALGMIERELKVRLDASEAASIAFHIVSNSDSAEGPIDASRVIGGVEGVLAIIRSSLGVELSASSSQYARLVTHLKYLIRRLLVGERSEDGAGPLYLNLDDPDARSIMGCVDRVAEYLQQEFQYDIGEAEKLYLFVHIVAVVQHG